MAARAGGDGDDPVGAFLDRLAREAVVDHVVERDPAPGVDRLVELDPRAERGDDDRHLPFRADLHVLLEAVVGAVDDLVDRERRRRALGMIAVPRRERFGDLVEPFVEQRGRARVERRKAADDPRRCTGR